MIVKEKNDFYGEDRRKYDLKVYDKYDKSFTMMVGGNGDLYWIPENHRETTTFYIPKEDRFLYAVFDNLFEVIRDRDDLKNPLLVGNEFNFISEDFHEDEANRLKITQTEDEFVIDFVRNEDRENWTLPHMGCNICFCNSGSRVPRVEQQFMIMFNELAYYCDEIEEVM